VRRRERGEDKYSTICGTAPRVKPVVDNWRFDKWGESRRGKNLSAKASESPLQLDNDKTFSAEELSASVKELMTSESPTKSFCGRRVNSAAVGERIWAYVHQVQLFYPLVPAQKTSDGFQRHIPEAIDVQEDSSNLVPLSFL
jgi:hypothetical protein